MINGLSMKVYQDGELIGNAALPRLVTDCTGDGLELGQEGKARSHLFSPGYMHGLWAQLMQGRSACVAAIIAS